MADVSALIRQRAAENEAWRESRQEERTNLSVMRTPPWRRSPAARSNT